MMKTRQTGALAAAALSVLLLVPGCSQHQKVEAGDAASRAKTEAKQFTEKARGSIDNGSMTLRIKTALVASERLNTGGINVDTEHQVVYLRGSVPDSGQRQLAEHIARDTAGQGIKVVNQLTISAPKK